MIKRIKKDFWKSNPGSPTNSRGIFTKLAFARCDILQQSSTLIVYLYFSSSLSLLTFRRAKSYKSARHQQSIAFGESWLRSLIKVQVNLTFNSLAQEFITAFCSGVAVRHPSVGCYLPSNPFILFLGGAELLQLATRFKRASN